MRRSAVLVLTLLLLLAAPGLVGAASASASSRARIPSRATWERQVARVMRGSVPWLEQRVAQAGPDARLAINLDIDNSALATTYAPGTAVKPTLRLARAARSMGVAVLFNTGRRPARLASTVTQLEAAGFVVDGICGKKPGVDVATNKQRCRDRFAEQGYTVTANVGNHASDFTGDGYERAYRLPSYGERIP